MLGHGKIPPFVYSMTSNPTDHPLFLESSAHDWANLGSDREALRKKPLESSGEMGVPIIEAVTFGKERELDAVILPNNGSIPGLPDESAVETPALADAEGIHPCKMEALPDAITSMLHTQAMIQKLLTRAYAEQSKQLLLQATLLEPTVDSYHNAVAMINEMCRLQKDILPPLENQGS